MQEKKTLNVFCVGRNYRLHALELGHEIPKEPLFFMKPTHAIALASGEAICVPGDQGAVHHEIECVVRIGDARPGLSLNEAIDSFALGLDLTLRDVQNEQRKKGDPWLLAKGFPSSAVLTPFQPYPPAGEEFSLLKNGKEVQHGHLSDMIFDMAELIEYCRDHFGLGEGDLIFTGTPAGVGPLQDGDRLEMLWGGEKLGECTISLRF